MCGSAGTESILEPSSNGHLNNCSFGLSVMNKPGVE